LPHPARHLSIRQAISAGDDLAPSPVSQPIEEVPMQLVADRFVVHDDERVVDLATATRVVLATAGSGNPSDQVRWTLRCDMWQRLHQRAIAPLLDYGLVGRSQRFEAWQCGPIWTGAADEATRIHDIAVRFLRSAGLTPGSESTSRVRSRNGGPVLLPDADAGYPDALPPAAAGGDAALEIRGLITIQRPAAAAIAEMFRPARGSRPHVAALWGPPLSGKTILVRELARIARVNGFVPISSRFVDTPYADLVQGRSLFVVDGGDGVAWWAAFLRATLRSPLPHVLLVVGIEELASIDAITLEPVSAEDLLAAVYPQPVTVATQAQIRRAARQARGLPGRFAGALWPRAPAGAGAGELGTERVPAVSRAAEQSAVYGGDERAERVVAASEAGTWPAPGELAALRRRMDAALTHLARGRYAPAIRQLRQTIAGLARRDAWADAGNGAVALASSLLRRGRPREAQAALEEARTYAGRAGRDRQLLDVAILSGEGWTDLARLDAAETVLSAALASASSARDRSREARASLALARCLFWRGEYGDAAAALSRPFDDVAVETRVRRELLAARIAVGQRDYGRAISTVAPLLQDAAIVSDPTLASLVACSAAFVHLAVGDLDAVDRDASTAVRSARAAHDPLRAIRARLLLAEAERRRGGSSIRRTGLQRLKRAAATVPPIVRACWELVMALDSGTRPIAETIARHVAASGLPALALLAPSERADEAPSFDPFVDEVVSILHACQTADDELVVLKDVCTRVRQHLHALSVGFVTSRAGRVDVFVAEGGRLDARIAERAIAAAILIAPHRHEDRIEAATPVQYGGSVIGALCARWTLGSTYDVSRTAGVLTMAAAAAAPLLSAAIVHRDRTVRSGVPELIGVTPAMTELRQAVERAAAAPFGVLIDGESGSGKELVARAVHRSSPRRDRAFCTLNCAALPDDLVEAELFGHARGAFTGAVAERPGVFEEAHGGTLFLDEVGELSPRAQAKVLRVIQEGEMRRVGENISRRVDVRIVSATNRDLGSEVEAGRFRLDLLYRLDVVRISVPPLRDRAEDIAVLVDHFWREATSRIGSRATLAAATVALLARYHWPGNVRELQNVLAALAVRSPKRGVVPPTALPPQFADRCRGELWRLEDARRTFEQRFVRAALVRSGGHRGRAAEELGVTRQGLTKLMTRLGITDQRASSAPD
jgi:DNA-binding NtrC family response regulator/tetratricopeptide (TPR) repeat protein